MKYVVCLVDYECSDFKDSVLDSVICKSEEQGIDALAKKWLGGAIRDYYRGLNIPTSQCSVEQNQFFDLDMANTPTGNKLVELIEGFKYTEAIDLMKQFITKEIDYDIQVLEVLEVEDYQENFDKLMKLVTGDITKRR